MMKRLFDPQELEPALIARAAAGDVAGMTALYEDGAVVATGAGRYARGAREIHDYFASLLDSGFVFEAGEQFPAIVSGGLALTSSRYPNGTLSSEVARKQDDGSWLWIIDYPTLGD